MALGAQTGKNACKFDGYVTATDNKYALGQLFQKECFIRCDDQIIAWKVRYIGPTSGCDEYFFSGNSLVANGDMVLVYNPCPTIEMGDASGIQHATVDAIQSGYLGVLVFDQFLPAETRASFIPAESPCILVIL